MEAENSLTQCNMDYTVKSCMWSCFTPNNWDLCKCLEIGLDFLFPFVTITFFPFFFFLQKIILLMYSWFIMLYSFLLYSKMIQLYTYTHTHTHTYIHTHTFSYSVPLWFATWCWIWFPVLYNKTCCLSILYIIVCIC